MSGQGSEKVSNERLKILLVESPEVKLEELRKIITEVYDVITVSKEQDAISLLNESSNNIAAGIFYIGIAKKLLSEIRSIPKLEKLSVLIATDVDNSELEDILLDLNAIDFLKKPFDKRRVLNRLKTAIKLSETNRIIDELERDELTSLLTRQAFLRKAEEVRSSNPDKTYCIIAFDFENFKSSNSLYGEAKCNEFLAYTGQHLSKAVDRALSGRFGGDQYVLFYEYDKEVHLDKLYNIRDTILNTAPIPHQIVKAGIYAPIDPELSMVVCCDRAFLAIRKIKGIYGKNISFYESSMQSELLNEQHIIETMERGLEEEQFLVFYQPKHEAVTGKIVGAEALVRWNHPEYGFMAPGQFIPLFERNGFITKLDAFILEKVCKDIIHWQQEGLPIVPVSVNVSRRDFMEPGCIANQHEIIEKYKIDHSLLHMEVTESLYSDNTEVIIEQVRETQKRGHMIEMDDFGSGYSSLGSLSSFPIDILKLDITFVRNIKTNEIIIENIIKMAHRMGLLTVAEGVEDGEQLRVLQYLGCDYIQGYYFSPPLPIKKFESYLKKTTVTNCGKIQIPSQENQEPLSLNESMLMAANEVAEGLPGGFITYHVDGFREIISFNRELLNIYACETAEEFRQKTANSITGLVFADDIEVLIKSINNQISGNNDVYNIDFRIKDNKGVVKYVSAMGRHVETKQYGKICFCFINDITERERRNAMAENERLKQLEMKRLSEFNISANKAKNIFMYNVARDIIPSLQTIIRYTNSIKECAGQEELVLKNVANAKQSEETLLAYVNDILEIARLESGEIKLVETATDITNATFRIYGLIEEAAKKKGIEVEYYEQIESPYIYQDVRHTVEMVLSIVQNAVKYTPSGGKVKFWLKQTVLKNKEDCIVEFFCQDNGIGMEEEFIPYACKSFTREANEVNAKIASSGLGLAVVQNLMTLMKGEIEIQSTKGKGTLVHTSQPHRLANKEDVLNETMLIEAKKF